MSGLPEVHHQPLSLMKTTFYNNAPMQMQIYADCLFRLVLWYINLQVHPPLLFAFKEIMWLFQSYLSRGSWSGMPKTVTGGGFHWQQPRPPLEGLCWTRQGTKLMPQDGSRVFFLGVWFSDEPGTNLDSHAPPRSCWASTGHPLGEQPVHPPQQEKVRVTHCLPTLLGT